LLTRIKDRRSETGLLRGQVVHRLRGTGSGRCGVPNIIDVGGGRSTLPTGNGVTEPLHQFRLTGLALGHLAYLLAEIGLPLLISVLQVWVPAGEIVA
jgi:hypothetical protein